MTYCIGINVNEGMVFASDSRTNAGLDNINVYTKMLNYAVGDRNLVIVTSGNLATSQAVFGSIKKDLEVSNPYTSLNTCETLEEVANYIGSLTVKHSSPQGINEEVLQLGSSYIVGGQIKNQKSEIYLVYPQGNYIRPSEARPYLIIGEINYGKPILDRVLKPDITLGDAARCALISMDSTIKSDLRVGPPIDFVVYKKGLIQPIYQNKFEINDPEYSSITDSWSQSIIQAFETFPRFNWEKKQ
jgi:putative proteasome-type protease